MNSIDVSKVETEKFLDIEGSVNFKKFNNKTFFENIDTNIEKIIYDVGLDETVMSAFVGSKRPYQEVLSKYDERYKEGLTKKNKTLINSAYDYAIMFLSPTLITYNGDVVTADEIYNGAYVFSELYDRFKPEDLPYGNLDGFVSYYKKTENCMKLVRKKG